ncbi:MAG: thioredoxin family protein [Rickettsiales bacterium]|jgi:thioredoxin 1|nr:thioredoxin family protein [Rickettsiales bacterium]
MKATTDATFEKDIQSGLVLVDFWAPWCGPCRQMLATFDEILPEIKNAEVYSMNVTENEETPAKFKIMSIPALMLFKDGELVDSKVGRQDGDTIKNWIVKHS